MTAPISIDPAPFLHERLESASPDLLRQMLTTFINTLISGEADAVCGAPHGLPGPERVNVRNGYRHRYRGRRSARWPATWMRSQRLDLRRVWRARRDSNPQPSDP
jgi:Transposase, Mutator family